MAMTVVYLASQFGMYKPHSHVLRGHSNKMISFWSTTRMQIWKSLGQDIIIIM